MSPRRQQLLGYDPGAAEMFIKAAESAPRSFVEHVLPVVLEVSDSTARGDVPPRRDPVWSYLIKSAHPGAEDGCLEALASAVGEVGKQARLEPCGEVIAELRRRDTHVANHLLLALYRGGAEHFADEMVAVVCAEQWRFECGFSGNSYWCAVETISAVAHHCARQSLERLEEGILGYVSRFEATVDGRPARGSSQFALLSAIPDELRSERAQRRFRELERKFGKPPSEPRAMGAQRVGPPISQEESEKMTDEQWLRAMGKYSSEEWWHGDGEIVGGAHQLSQVLETSVKKEPGRFARLALKLDPEGNPAYMERTLAGLCDAELSAELKLDVCREGVCGVPGRLREGNCGRHWRDFRVFA